MFHCYSKAYFKSWPEVFDLTADGRVRLKGPFRPPNPHPHSYVPLHRRYFPQSPADYLSIAQLFHAIRNMPKPYKNSPSLDEVHHELVKRYPDNPRWQTENRFSAFLYRFSQANYYDLPLDDTRFGRRQNPQILICRRQKAHFFRETVLICAGENGFASLKDVHQLFSALQPSIKHSPNPNTWLSPKDQQAYTFDANGFVKVTHFPLQDLPVHYRAVYDRATQALYHTTKKTERTTPHDQRLERTESN